MGEKEIVQDSVGAGGSSLIGGGPPVSSNGGQVGQPAGPDTAGGPGGGTPPPGKPTSDGPGGGGQQADDCFELEMKFRELKEAFEALRQKNQEFSDKAVDAFFRNEGYRDTVQKAKVTEAVVDSNNEVGSKLIDIALFAAGGYAGLAKVGGASAGWSKVAGKWVAPSPSGAVTAAEGMFGKGIYGSEDSTAAIKGIGGFLGKMTGTDLGGEAVKGGPLSGMADRAKDAVLDALKGWMKEGATSPGLEAAKKAYADFVGAATAANAAAAGAADVRKQMVDVINEAEKKKCPPFGAAPDPYVRTFDIAPFGTGAMRGEGGPTTHRRTVSGGKDLPSDMFNAGSKGMLL